MTTRERARKPRKRRMTAAEFEALPEDDEYHYELARGVLVRERRARGGMHGRIWARLTHRLYSFVEEHALGELWGDTHFQLSADPPTIRRPDLGFIANERIPTAYTTDILPVAPDLAVEITSRSNTVPKMQQKLLEYRDSGVRAVWLFDPRTRSAMIYKSRTLIELLDRNAVVDGGDVLPGFRLPLTELYSR